jgi:hypothetical protein
MNKKKAHLKTGGIHLLSDPIKALHGQSKLRDFIKTIFIFLYRTLTNSGSG